MQRLKSVLLGCRAESDGLIAKWANRINFGIASFGNPLYRRDSAFGASQTQMFDAVAGLAAGGGTPMSQAIMYAAREIKDAIPQLFSPADASCRPNYIVLLSDGEPNGSNGYYWRGFGCGTWNNHHQRIPRGQPEVAARLLYDIPDMMCNVPGDQNITTFTIGFASQDGLSTLKTIAKNGHGQFFEARDSAKLTEAFATIMEDIMERSTLTYASVAVESGTLYDGNHAYMATFESAESGAWPGTIQKFCVKPPIQANGSYGNSRACLFYSDDGKTLRTNPTAEDLWTGKVRSSPDKAGTTLTLIDQLSGSTASKDPRAPYWSHRNLLSWKQGESAYRSLTPDTWTPADSGLSRCDHQKLLNYLHGYTWNANCADEGQPVAISRTPMGSVVHFSPIVLKYGKCFNQNDAPVPGACFVVAGADDGLLHIFDAADGRETSALAPAELWSSARIAFNPMGTQDNQPVGETTHRYMVDGVPRLYHEDDNADSIIQPNEKAWLVFGLGRGGAAYYALSVSGMQNGLLTTSGTPIYPIYRKPGTAFASLQATWAAPWFGEHLIASNTAGQRPTAVKVAAFASGHHRGFDLNNPNHDIDAQNLVPESAHPAQTLNRTYDCLNRNGYMQLASGQGVVHCSYYNPQCNSQTCYEARVKNEMPDGLVFDLTRLYDETAFATPRVTLTFDHMEIRRGDKVIIEDAASRHVLHTFQQARGAVTSVEFEAKSFRVRVEADNSPYIYGNSGWYYPPAAGFQFGQLRMKLTPKASGTHNPTVYLVDMAKWNASSPSAFAQDLNGDGVMVRVTRDCQGIDETRCIDLRTNPDLAHMVCPISSEISGYTEENILKALYWGDECGQIWKAWPETGGKSWKAERMINLNNGRTGRGRDFRKIFRRLDLVLTGCPGTRAVAIHFGTGDVQHPTETQLTDTQITSGHDIIGVLWDTSDEQRNLTQANLADVTDHPEMTAGEIRAQNKEGWYISLEKKNERMLRDPFVLNGVAYYKTYSTTKEATSCSGGSGLDQIYAVSNCSGQPRDGGENGQPKKKADRISWTGNSSINSDLFFTAGSQDGAMLSHGDFSTEQAASINQSTGGRPGLFLWREL